MNIDTERLAQLDALIKERTGKEPPPEEDYTPEQVFHIITNTLTYFAHTKVTTQTKSGTLDFSSLIAARIVFDHCTRMCKWLKPYIAGEHDLTDIQYRGALMIFDVIKTCIHKNDKEAKDLFYIENEAIAAFNNSRLFIIDPDYYGENFYPVLPLPDTNLDFN